MVSGEGKILQGHPRLIIAKVMWSLVLVGVETGDRPCSLGINPTGGRQLHVTRPPEVNVKWAEEESP